MTAGLGRLPRGTKGVLFDSSRSCEYHGASAEAVEDGGCGTADGSAIIDVHTAAVSSERCFHEGP